MYLVSVINKRRLAAFSFTPSRRLRYVLHRPSLSFHCPASGPPFPPPTLPLLAQVQWDHLLFSSPSLRFHLCVQNDLNHGGAADSHLSHMPVKRRCKNVLLDTPLSRKKKTIICEGKFSLTESPIVNLLSSWKCSEAPFRSPLESPSASLFSLIKLPFSQASALITNKGCRSKIILSSTVASFAFYFSLQTSKHFLNITD